MKLFFETAAQASSFLASIPLGFASALCLDTGKSRGVCRIMMDLLLVLFTGLSLLTLMFLIHDSQVRMYHVLGLISGVVLYLRGFGYARFRLRRSRLLRKKVHEKEENPPQEAK